MERTRGSEEGATTTGKMIVKGVVVAAPRERVGVMVTIIMTVKGENLILKSFEASEGHVTVRRVGSRDVRLRNWV